MTVPIHTALSVACVLLAGFGVGWTLASLRLPRGRLDERQLNDVVNRHHNEIEQLKHDLKQLTEDLDATFAVFGRLEGANERKEAA